MDSSNSSLINLHVAILFSPGMGHLIPMVLLSNSLSAHHNITVIVLLVTTTVSSPEFNLLKIPLHLLVNILELPPANISHLVFLRQNRHSALPIDPICHEPLVQQWHS
ncbi:hydroquinone glucosyltransferase [Salvia divinorum]|uniref:Hydroquinone glucosyltransferase n=1 Tax=Salvia divinorum TaxID=28513 RepID=A0ABD1GDF0_SALDI